jgi:hypothetical protein
MNIEYPAFGRIVIDGVEYDHDVVIKDGRVAKRSKRPSKSLRSEYGHTPLSEYEEIPMTRPRLIIGAGYSGRLPLTPGVHDEARRHRITLEIMPTRDACVLLSSLDPAEWNAVLHVTC